MEDAPVKYTEALSVFKEHSARQKEQRLRGLNDFNIFTTLLNQSDEVRLHSSFIHFLLNPSANHYQSSLFLALFLQCCGVSEDFMTLDSVRVFKEYRFDKGAIDIYITDGVSHIIIENKIHSRDQPRQLQKYIDFIKEEDTDSQSTLSDRLMVIYLSLDRPPTQESLGRFNNKGERLEREGESYPYKHITYDEHIMAWIEQACNEVANITNLSVIINQYRDVINKLYGKYQGKVMSLHEFIEKQPDKVTLYRTFGEIASEYPKLKLSVMTEFWDKAINRLSDSVQAYPWIVECTDKDRLDSGRKFGYPLRVKWDEEDIAVFAFEFHEPDYHKPMWGIFSANNPDVMRAKTELEEQSSSLPRSLNKSSVWWMKFGFLDPDDFFDWVIEQSDINTAVEKFTTQFMEVCLPCMNFIQLINQQLRVKGQ